MGNCVARHPAVLLAQAARVIRSAFLSPVTQPFCAAVCLPSEPRTAYFVLIMSASRCSECGAELVTGTNFCRQCGAAVANVASEQQTAILHQSTLNPTTQRLDPRPTSGTPHAPRAEFAAQGVVPVQGSGSHHGPKRALFLGGIVVALVVATGAVFFVTQRVSRVRRASGESTNQLSYPGARTIVDVSGEDGGRVLQQETTDQFDKVTAWYASNLKPTKTIRATGTTVIMKNERITATIVGTGEGASIVIKQAPR